MEKREKVLIALMIVAIGIGAFELFVRPSFRTPIPPPTVHVDEAVNLSTTISQSMAKMDLGPEENHILQTAATQWANNPFYAWPAPRDNGVMADRTEPSLDLEQIRAATVYSGYLEMGRTRIAVINGLEYQAGEMLPDGKYVVLNISPLNVTLQAERSKQEIIIPYQDAFIEE